MATNRQIAANRRNAQRSTGPKTEEGKARSSGNALTHGLTAQRNLLDDEDAERFEALCEHLRSELKPVGVLEELCVDRLAQTLWRLRRVPVYEAAILKWTKPEDRGVNRLLLPIGEELPLNSRNALLEVALPTDAFAKLDRHEAHLARQAQGISEQLATLQKERLAASAAEAALNAPNLGQVTAVLIAPPATPLIGKVIEGRALPGPQVDKPETVAPMPKSDSSEDGQNH
jgi:hypothetical protein